MLIYLNKSKLFTEDPAMRFAREYMTTEQMWNELWRRYKVLEYTVPELCEYMQIKTGSRFNERTMRRWVTRSELYHRAHPFVSRGVHTATTELFGEFEQDVINELMKHMKNDGAKSTFLIV